MSQRILKCIVCGGDHSIFHCEHKCSVCHGDNRQCSCTDQPQNKRKKTAKQQKQSSQSGGALSYNDLRKLYENLQKEHERVGQAFQTQQHQNADLTQELAKKEKDAEELADLVRDKCEVIKNMERRLVQAKKVIADLKAEVNAHLQSARTDGQQDDNQLQQQQQRDIGPISTHSLANIHGRYKKVVQALRENQCGMVNAFRLSGCPRSTVRDFVAIAELKIVDSREHDLVIRDHIGSVKELEAVCRKRLRRHLPLMANMRREGQLLPLKFDGCFYE